MVLLNVIDEVLELLNLFVCEFYGHTADAGFDVVVSAGDAAVVLNDDVHFLEDG